MYLEEVKHLEKQLKDIEKQDEKAVRRSSIRKEHTVNPWGRSSIVRSVLGELRDPSNFNNPKTDYQICRI